MDLSIVLPILAAAAAVAASLVKKRDGEEEHVIDYCNHARGWLQN